MTKEEFEALPINKQRCLVAQDIINSIKENKYIPVTHGYIVLSEEELEALEGKELQQEINNMGACSACAIGCAFISLVKFTDDYKISNCDWFLVTAPKAYLILNGNTDNFRDRNVKFWGQQIDLIESAYMLGYEEALQAFEDRYIYNDGGYTESLQRAIDFGKDYKENASRLVAIMENVITNNGTFKP